MQLEDYEGCEGEFRSLRMRIARREQNIKNEKDKIRKAEEVTAQPTDFAERIGEKQQEKVC